ncbi:hypothetical protein H9P43_002971 [Blastocladiella emersonii ATCC 22665]|nr:hypothetical protein H9P43_002971 [Blastocladiella emersonii ATCC 22665]
MFATAAASIAADQVVVTLKTSDDYEVKTTLAAMYKSGLVKSYFTVPAAPASPSAAASDNGETAGGAGISELPLPTITKATLDRILEWLEYHAHEAYVEPPADVHEFEVYETERRKIVSQWDLAFYARIPTPAQRVQLFQAAGYMQVMPLHYLAAKLLGRELRASTTKQAIRDQLRQVGVPGMTRPSGAPVPARIRRPDTRPSFI